MPSWRFDLTDSQIASVVNELFARWNPQAPPVTEDLVRRVREKTEGKNLFPSSVTL